MSQLDGLRIALVGPLPPPAGGMATQTEQLARLLSQAGAEVQVVQVNPPYRPAWIARWRGVRAAARLLPYAAQLWRAAGWADVLHVMANSGWSWHLFAAPAIRIAAWRGCPVVVNYRGGEAAVFLARSADRVVPVLRRAQALVVPSGFLQEVFARHGLSAQVVPNIVDLARFYADPRPLAQRASVILVARHLEPIYGLDVAVRAFARVAAELPGARLVLAGQGPERAALERLAAELGVAEEVEFSGPLQRDAIAARLRAAAIALNASRIDNMPNSVLEAMASGVPVVSTAVGGVPWVVRDGVSALLVPPDDETAMAHAILKLLRDPALATRLAGAGQVEVQAYAWPRVRAQWGAIYSSVRRSPRPQARVA
ncbi:MAG: glycosyltransferase family 4 protein [Burkholderiaceae bacterium]